MSKPSKKGFTLVEMMVVVAIIGVLAAVVTPQISGTIYKSRVAATAMSLKNFKMGIDRLVDDLGVKPNVWGGLRDGGDAWLYWCGFHDSRQVSTW